MVAELFGSGGSDQVVVFESHTALAFDVASGFERDDIAGDEGVGTFGNQNRWFRVLHSKSMSRVVSECPESSLFKHG